jgi:hypothetical protein
MQAMMMMNRQVNLPAMQRVMMEFEKQSEFMDMKQEVEGRHSVWSRLTSAMSPGYG